MFFLNLGIYILSFIMIWFGAGLITSSTDHFSRKLRLSSFAMSFIVLGILTSIPEFAVGLTAVSNHQAEIFVGNLLGGIPVIFLFIIPILAILGNGIQLRTEFDTKKILLSLGVILAPSLLVLDRRVTNIEGIILIAAYLILIYYIERKRGILDNHSEVLSIKSYSYKDILKIILGIVIVFISSNIIVDKTIYFSTIFHISTFYISLVLLSIGTNLPELSLAARAIISGEKDVAFGDYMGSASANTFLFGIFTLINNGEVITVNNFGVTFFFLVVGLLLFYYFVRTGNAISKSEGAILLFLYAVFIFVEFIR